jgi:hypothetical protein
MPHKAPASTPPGFKFGGLFLQLSGWAIVVSALVMLPASAARIAFVIAGIAVEILGWALLIYGHGFVRRSDT